VTPHWWVRYWRAAVTSVRRHPGAYAGTGAGAVAAGVTAIVLMMTSATVPAGPGGPATTPAAATGPLTSPFTGEPVAARGPVLALKIDNVVRARPQTGLKAADVVYVLPVEGGLSRFLAVYSAHLPPVAGPVRSAREDDLGVLRQFGTPAFGYSGATPHLLPFVHRARIVDLYAGLPKPAAAYFRDNGRAAPYNLYARPATLLADARGASTARDIGFRFGPAPASAHGKPTASFAAGYPAAAFTFTWSAAQNRWLVSMDASPAKDTTGGQLGAPTIVIQYTTVRTSRFLEYGAPPPYAQSVGHGTAIVLRDGKACTVTWSRPNADAGTAFTTAAGERMTFARGPVWVLLTAPPR
jgi:Protein of unknown function (DUF3048) N-terminal domain/Protein of unknown function (DUF3048) C-terminal domain